LKIALKYGIAVALVIAAWVALKNFVLHFEGPAAQGADFAIFNLSAIVALFLGIRERRALTGGSLSFGEGLKTGVLIAITYALLVSLYFAVLLLLVGPRLMQQAGHTSYVSAFAGLFIGLVLFGAIFSAVISVILRRS
jgi:hypothetical protein